MVALTQKTFSAHNAWFLRGGSHIMTLLLNLPMLLAEEGSA